MIGLKIEVNLSKMQLPWQRQPIKVLIGNLTRCRLHEQWASDSKYSFNFINRTIL